jgi:hypothetical protein
MTMDTSSPSCSTALALPTPIRPAVRYARHALCNPVSLSIAVVALALAAAYVGPLGAVLAVTLVLGACVGVARSRIVRRHLDRRLEARARQQREAGRMRALGPAGPMHQHQYAELRDLVAQVERADPLEARRCELQELLAHYVRSVVLYHRCVAALELAGTKLASDSPPYSKRSSRASEIAARRIRHRDTCRQRVEHLADEIEATDQLVRLIAQRVACPQLDDDLAHELDRRLLEVDQMDAAIEQLSA